MTAVKALARVPIVLVGLTLFAIRALGQEASVAGDALRGEKVFRRNCTQCHALNENRIGPRLGDVYGRAIGSVPGFRYSAAILQQTFVWSDSTLDVWLAGPRDFIREAAMPARLKDIQKRSDVIAYLRAMTSAAGSSR